MKEEKFVLVVQGAIIVAAVQFGDPANPNRNAKPHRFVLTTGTADFARAGGIANGFRAIETGTRIMFFSSATLEESGKDDFRFPYDHWGKDIWDVEHR